MNQKLTLSDLSQLLANETGLSKRTAENFLREFFSQVSEALVNGETVKIPGLGMFRLNTIEARKSVDVNTGEQIEIPSHNRITFLPAKEMAQIINAPFDMFEPVELADGVTEDMLNGEETLSVPEEVAPVVTETETPIVDTLADMPSIEWLDDDDEEETPAPEPEEEIIEPEQPEEEPQPIEEPETLPTEEEPVAEESPVVDEKPVEVAEEEETPSIRPIQGDGPQLEPSRRGFHFGTFALGLLAGAAVCVAIWLWTDFYRDDVADKGKQKVEKQEVAALPDINLDETEPEATAEEAESAAIDSPVATEEVAMPQTKPSDEEKVQKPQVRYDTITKTRYLTTMAKEYYGKYQLWPYIYEENKAKLGHPDRIKPGTKVVIPDLKKYGVNPNSKADIEKANRMGAEIYSRYRQ